MCSVDIWTRTRFSRVVGVERQWRVISSWITDVPLLQSRFTRSVNSLVCMTNMEGMNAI